VNWHEPCLAIASTGQSCSRVAPRRTFERRTVESARSRDRALGVLEPFPLTRGAPPSTQVDASGAPRRRVPPISELKE
jgi:hypothetical protein